MTASSRPVAVVPWLALIGATIASFLLCEEGIAAPIATSLVLVIAMIKIHLIVGHFMEVRWAAQPWRWVLEIWTGVVGAIVLGGYWFSTF